MSGILAIPILVNINAIRLYIGHNTKMEIQYPDNFLIEEYNDKFLWRYIDLHRLIDLLNNKHLYFTRFDNFEDGLEGLTGKGIGLKVFTQGNPITKDNINKSFDEEIQLKLIKDDKNRRQLYLDTLTGSQQTQFANCWFLGDRESLAMWKLYSKNDGVAIKFNARQLINTVIATAKSYTKTDFKILYLGPVKYKNIWPFDPYEKFDGKFNGLKKDKSYIHENEFRFVVVVPSEKKGEYKNFILPIGELSAYDLKIITNPFMKKWEVENLKKLLSKYELDQLLMSSKMEIRN